MRRIVLSVIALMALMSCSRKVHDSTAELTAAESHSLMAAVSIDSLRRSDDYLLVVENPRIAIREGSTLQVIEAKRIIEAKCRSQSRAVTARYQSVDSTASVQAAEQNHTTDTESSGPVSAVWEKFTIFVLLAAALALWLKIRRV